MTWSTLFSVVLLMIMAKARGEDPVGPTLPWGIHLAYGADPATTMTVGWSTREPVPNTVVLYGLDSGGDAQLDQVATGNATTFQPPGTALPQDLHLVHLTELEPGTKYAYVVCSDESGTNASDVFHFTTAFEGSSSSTEWTPTLAIFGDMGISSNAQDTLVWLLKDLNEGTIDFIAHIGDHGYDLHDDNGARGDSFMVQQTPLAANLPYHAGPGNHEDFLDFIHYRKRIGAAMPLAEGAPSQGGSGIFHSVSVGLIHFAFVNSESYFTPQPHGLGLLREQRAWLEADLAAVDRSVTPWVVIGLHQPFYCSPNDDADACHKPVHFNPPRDGYPGVGGGLEDLAYEYGVDLVFGAHEHAYERFYPIYQNEWNASSSTGPEAYVEYDAPVNILTGAAGCPEDFDVWQNTSVPFSAIRFNEYGYSRMKAFNTSHARLQYVENQDGGLLDEVWLVRSQHGPYGQTP